MPWMHDGMGKQAWANDADVSLWTSQGWAPVESAGPQNVATNTGQVKDVLDYLLQTGQLEATQYANLTQRFNVQGNLGIDAFNAATARGSAAGDLFFQHRGPRDYMQASNLSRSGQGNVSDLWAAVQGLTPGLEYGQQDPNNLDPLTWDGSGAGDMFGGGGSGGGGGSADLSSQHGGTDSQGNSVDLYGRQDGSRDLNGIGYISEGPGAIGNPRRNLESLGLKPIGPNGEWLAPTWDASGNPIYPPGYNGPKYPRMPTNAIEEQQWSEWVRAGMPEDKRPAYDGGAGAQAQQQGTQAGKAGGVASDAPGGGTKGGSATPQPVAPTPVQSASPTASGRAGGVEQPRVGETAADTQYRTFYNDNPVMREATKYGTPANAQAGPNGTTIVTYSNKSQRAFDSTGKEVSPSPGVAVGVKPPGGQIPPTGPTAKPPVVSAPAPVTTPSIRPPGVNPPASGRSGGVGAPRPSSIRPPGVNPPASGRAGGRAPGNDSNESRNELSGERAEQAQKSGVHVNAASRKRAEGGMDVLPKWAARMQGGDLEVVTRPTRFAEGGQRFLVGEGGKDELVTKARYPDKTVVRVDPLERDDTGVPPEIAEVANQLVPGDPYEARGGMPATPVEADACPCCGMPREAHDVPMDDEYAPIGGDMPPEEMDLLAKAPAWAREMQMATGGMAVMQPLSPGATIKPSSKPFTPPKPKKNAPPLTNQEPQYVKDGQINALVGPNKYKKMSVSQNLPYQDANQIRAAVWNNLSPMEMGLVESQVEKLGDSMETYLHRRAMGMQAVQRQGSPFGSRLRRGF